jgi:hypothetical protein
MKQQINLYLTQADIEKIEGYLSTRKFVFIKDEILIEPKSLPQNKLFSQEKWARFITLSSAHLNYQNFQEEGQQKFRLSVLDTEAMRFGVFGKNESLFRVRFYYDVQDFEKISPKNPELSLLLARFFRWLRRQYKRVPDMPTFYYNPAFPPKEWF